jgi:uncharacterized protein
VALAADEGARVDADGTQVVLGVSGWRWLNEPGTWTADDGTLRVDSDRGTDFWVATHYGFVRDTGHALLRPVPAAFRMRVSFDGAYRDQYDQAGLLLRLDDRNWVKTGIEYVGGRRQLSAVVTRDVSDWSVAPLGGDAPQVVTVEVRRAGDTVTVLYGTGAEEPATMLRLAYFPPGAPAQAGPMCASPDGGGFRTVFSDFRTE